MDYLLDVEGVSKSFPGTLALDGVRLQVKAGEVHALVGENGAGKSTLMNIIAGVLRRDSGVIRLDGNEVDFAGPRDACFSGVGFVHQEMSLCMHVSVAENVHMWNIPAKRGGMIDFPKLHDETDKLLREFGTNFDSHAIAGNLTVAQQQIVEIVRALSMNAKLIIFDEPTSSLTENEAENLFRFIRQLKQRGVGVLYISHRMPEVFTLCDRVTILRDGRYVDTCEISEVGPSDVVSKMVGRDIGEYYPAKSGVRGGEVLLSVRNLSGGRFSDISFELRKGEILGFSGLIGAGRTELMQAICGYDKYESGSVELLGEQLPQNLKTSEVIGRGLFYLTEDRRKNGLFLRMTTRRNISVTVLDSIANGIGFLDFRKEREIAVRMIREMDVRVSSDEVDAGNMSGGNQQKVMIAKWLASRPRVLILDEPTRGIDVGSKSEIHHKLRRLCDDGVGVIVISSELPEVIGVSDRVVVLHEGVKVGEASGEDINEEHLMMMASNQMKEIG